MSAPANIQPLLQFFHRYDAESTLLSPEFEEFMRAVFKERRYRKKDFLLHADDVPQNSWFIVKGSARTYFYDPEAGREITCWFWYEGEWILSLKGLFTQEETNECIELLQDCTVLMISASDMKKMVRLFPEYRLFERCLIEDYQSRMADHYHDLKSMANRHKFNKLMETHKEIFNLAYIRDIASFLDMHPATLSRMRRGEV